MNRGIAVVLLLVLSLLGSAALAQEEFYTRMPEALVAKQSTRSDTGSATPMA